MPEDSRHARTGLATVSPRCVILGWLAALATVLIQQWLVPLNAGAQMGFFSNGGDLDIYRHGSMQILHGQPLYATEIPPGGWFTYPPFAAITFTPLALLPFTAAKALWMLISWTALTATIWRCATVLGYRADRQLGLLSIALSLTALNIEPVRGTLWQGQVNLVLMSIIVWDLTRPRGAKLRGWSVGIATGIKLTAIVFIPYLLITRQWRAAITAAATAAGTVALTWVLLPADSTSYWFDAVSRTDRIGPLTHPGNHSLGGILSTLWFPTPMPTLCWILAVAVAAILGYYAAYRAELAAKPLAAVIVTGLLSCTVPPLAWGHHWVWVVPLLALTINHAIRANGNSRWLWVTASAAIYLATFMWYYIWLYRSSMNLDTQYPTYFQAWDAVITHMTRPHKLLVVSTPPLLFFITAITAIALAKSPTKSTEATESANHQPRYR